MNTAEVTSPTFRCPFCGGKFEAVQQDNGTPGVVHSMPPCEKFIALDVIAFLRAARLAGTRQMQ